MQNGMAIATKQIKKQIDWPFPKEKEKAPHISFEEFCKVTDE